MKHKGNKNLTYTQRVQIETMLIAKNSRKQICEIVGIDKSTLSREIRKGLYKHKVTIHNFWKGNKIVFENRYSALLSQERYARACKNKGRDLKLGKDFELVKYIEKRVNEDKLSACAVLGEIKRKKLPFTNISKTTLYRYIDLGYFSNIKIEKRKTVYRKQVIKRAPRGTSIEKRPAEIFNRNTFGHWEMDCVCGSTRSTLLVLSERLTRKEIIFKMENQKSESVIRCLNVLEREYGKSFKKIFKSITVDNGSEFANYKGLERSIFGRETKRTTVYYCHPYSSYERGTNERLNREIRRLIPKGSNLAKYSHEDIKSVEAWVNNYPREVLGYATSAETFEKQLRLIN